jgi:two-component system NarL family sensor kinase
MIEITLFGGRNGATLRVSDNGIGIAPTRNAKSAQGGLGLRNMQERVEQLDGSLKVLSNRNARSVPSRGVPIRGTTIEAHVPLSHMLPPENDARKIS